MLIIETLISTYWNFRSTRLAPELAFKIAPLRSTNSFLRAKRKSNGL